MSNNRNWTVDAYVNDAWTKLVTSPADLSCVVIANTSGGAINVQMRLADLSGSGRAVILPTKSVAASTAETLAVPGLKIGKHDVLEVRASASGVNFTASGSEAN